MRILITGINGFIGSHLAEHLLQTQPKAELFGLIRAGSSLENLVKIAGRINLLKGDLKDFRSIIDAFYASKPDCLFHLAGLTSQDLSFNQPVEALSLNLQGTLNLLEVAREFRLSTSIIIASCAEAYGLAYSDELPIKESSIFRPLSPLGVSKAAQDLLAFQFQKAYGLKIIRVRIFSLLGPRLPDHYLPGSLTRQIAEIEKKKREPVLQVAHLDHKRDYLDIRDAVRALSLLAEKGDSGEAYNLGSGRAWSGEEILKILLTMTRARVVVATDEARMKLPDPPILLADTSKLIKTTGWKPQLEPRQSLLDLLNYWREKI